VLPFFDVIMRDAWRTTTNWEMERIEERADRNVIHYILQFVVVRKNYKNGMEARIGKSETGNWKCEM
jgi:hypothetical protein